MSSDIYCMLTENWICFYMITSFNNSIGALNFLKGSYFTAVILESNTKNEEKVESR